MRKLYFEYDECNICDNIVDFIYNNLSQEDKRKTSKDKILYQTNFALYGDEFIFAYNDFCEQLGELFLKKCKERSCKIKGVNLDYRHNSGYKYISIDCIDYINIGKELLRYILPKTQDFTINVSLYKSSYIQIMIYHHDCPCGSKFIIYPCSFKTYKIKTL